MRLKYKLQWSITVLITLTISGSYILKRNQIINNDKLISTTMSYMSWQLRSSQKYVTKSMTELGKMDEINRHVLFLNSVPQCGAEILILLLQRMQGRNNFRHVRLKGGNKRKLTKQQQEKLVYEIQDAMKKEAVPLSFDRHVYFVNFTRFDKQSPTFVNIIRDPTDKAMSGVSLEGRSNYWPKCIMQSTKNCNYKTGKSYDLTISYFCGHDPRCMILNSDWALNTAKSNVDKFYPTVGVLEELNVTLEVLENKIPFFFKNAQATYQNDLLRMYKKRKTKKIPSKIKTKLKETLVKEYEFYDWVKSRLFQDLQRIYGEHHGH